MTRRRNVALILPGGLNIIAILVGAARLTAQTDPTPAPTATPLPGISSPAFQLPLPAERPRTNPPAVPSAALPGSSASISPPAANATADPAALKTEILS